MTSPVLWEYHVWTEQIHCAIHSPGVQCVKKPISIFYDLFLERLTDSVIDEILLFLYREEQARAILNSIYIDTFPQK